MRQKTYLTLVELATATAREEIRKEEFREQVELEKKRLRSKRSLFDRLFPWVIIIRRKV